MAEEPNWFAEPPLRGFRQAYRVGDCLVREDTAFQSLEILQSEALGRMLVLNGAIQTTELDEFIYHEMLALVPLLTHPSPRKAAIVGGGDGGTLRRVVGCPTVEAAYQIELDPRVTQACLEHIPSVSAGAVSHPAARVVYGDGARFMADSAETFDVILIDSTDPIGPAEVLFSEGFYRDVFARLSSDGVMATQSGSPLLMHEELLLARQRMAAVFGEAHTYCACVPSYPGVLWSFTLCSKGRSPLDVPVSEIEARLASWGERPHYYTPALHSASFALPAFLRDSLAGPHPIDLFPA